MFAAACEWVNANTPKDLTNKTKMQKLVYNQVREQFGLSANLAIQALRRVCSNRKTARQKNRNVRKFSFRLGSPALYAKHECRDEKAEANQKPRSKTERRHSNNWSFYMLRQFLTYKCVLKGVPLILVNPAYTSVSCHKCLHLGKRNGKSFRCVNPECLNRCDPDYQGALNLAALGRSINTPGGSGLACKLHIGVREYIQLNLFSEDLGLLKTPSSSIRPQVC